MKVLATCLLLAILLPVAESAEYDRNVTLKAGVFDVLWYFNATSTRFYFKIQANTTGWAALGITDGTGAGMKNIDIALGGVKAGNAYLKDYFSTTKAKPELDGKQDFDLTSGVEYDTMTFLEFNRPADTTDSIPDKVIKFGTKYTLCFAIATTDITDPTTFNEHSDKGCTSVKYDMYPQGYHPPTNSSTSTTSKTSSTPSTFSPSPTRGHLMLPSLMVLVLAQVAINFVY